MSTVKFDGFIQNYDPEETPTTSVEISKATKVAVQGILDRYQSLDPVFPVTMRVGKIEFTRELVDPSWKARFNGVVYISEIGVANRLVRDTNDSGKDTGIQGLTNTFTVPNLNKGIKLLTDTVQIFVCFRGPVID